MKFPAAMLASAVGLAGLAAGCDRATPPAVTSSATPSTVATMNPDPASHTPASLHTNRLAQEKSPYLLQHRHNPVDWYPWGEAAFERARRENKPILVSIGYSTCHWCHVMERESFEDAAVGRFLNEHFVSIKVDREERPDVDKIYMTYVQATTGHGGWPLNVFLTPQLKPFFGGTYFPPERRHGRPNFLDVLQQVHEAWTSRRARVEASAEDIHRRLSQQLSQAAPGEDLDARWLERAASGLKRQFDSRHGGFGGAPKFPRPSVPGFLLRYGARIGDREAIAQVRFTAERMAAGGIHDQLGGGFARYAVDARWEVPHFEKMLYDNAQLLELYIDLWQLGGEARFAEVARGIATYVLRDMTHPEGGFYSAEDADSEGKEGKFYCWTEAEVKACVDAADFELVRRCFGITREGNFVDHSDPDPLPNQNVLTRAGAPRDADEAARLERARDAMLKARAARVRPHLDDKILSSWNGLMVGALARAGRALGERPWIEAAQRNIAFLRAKLWDERSGALYHRWRDGERDQVQLLDAYAFLAWGLTEVYQATLQEEYLAFAIRLADSMVARFHDAADGGFWQSGAESRDLILRLKEDYDGAEPSGNSMAVLTLQRLATITGRESYARLAESTLRRFAAQLERAPEAMPRMLQALDAHEGASVRVVIARGTDASGFADLLAAAHRGYVPNRIVLAAAGSVEDFSRNLPAVEGRATAYVCRGTTCSPPTRDPAELRGLLTAP